MTGRGRSLFHVAFGVAAGIAGLAGSRCAGGSCSSCWACAVPGASVVLLGVMGKLASRRKVPAVVVAVVSDARALGRAEGHSSP